MGNSLSSNIGSDLPETLAHLLQARRTVSPRHLVAPGPEGQQLETLLNAAGHAPDHGNLLPWRLVIVPPSARPNLGEAFAQALLERDPQASDEALARARAKALRAPLLLLMVLQLNSNNSDIGNQERLLSAGCAVQNILLAATALGFGSALTSGKALPSKPLRSLFGLEDTEQALCFVNIGSIARQRPLRTRPQSGDYVQILRPGQGRADWPGTTGKHHGNSPL